MSGKRRREKTRCSASARSGAAWVVFDSVSCLTSMAGAPSTRVQNGSRGRWWFLLLVLHRLVCIRAGPLSFLFSLGLVSVRWASDPSSHPPHELGTAPLPSAACIVPALKPSPEPQPSASEPTIVAILLN
jgi:hypothetical protein